MSYIKKIVISSLLFTALSSVFLSAMQCSSGAKIQEELKAAIDAYNFEQAEICLELGANPNAIYPEIYHSGQSVYYKRRNATLLEYYAVRGTAEQVGFLLDRGADPFHSYKGREHVLKDSLFNTTESALKIIPLLVEKVGVDYVDPASKDSLTALEYAIKIATHTDIAVIELLLRLGANPNRRDRDGATVLDRVLPPLNWSCSETINFPLVKLLYRYGAETDTQGLQKRVTNAQMAELEQARKQTREKCVQDKALYDQELGNCLPQFPMPLLGICSDYIGTVLPRAVLDELLADEEESEAQNSVPEEETWCSIS